MNIPEYEPTPERIVEPVTTPEELEQERARLGIRLRRKNKRGNRGGRSKGEVIRPDVWAQKDKIKIAIDKGASYQQIAIRLRCSRSLIYSVYIS